MIMLWKRNYRDTCSSRPKETSHTVLEAYPYATPCDDTLGNLETYAYTIRMIAADGMEMYAFRRPYRDIVLSSETAMCLFSGL
jgi:hypothetical protein